MKYKYVFWDFNGTILDDLKLCVKILNQIIKSYNLPSENISHYRLHMKFPIAEYYKEMGLPYQGEEFHKVSEYFNSTYMRLWKKETKLSHNFIKVADFLKRIGIKQIMASAALTDNLIMQTTELDIIGYFDVLLGQSGIHAESKVSYIKKHIQSKMINPDEILFIGDTLHDYEVAKACGSRCILYSGGHQSKELFTGIEHIDDLKDLLNYL